MAFYEGLLDNSKILVDASSGGSFTVLEPTQAEELLEKIATNGTTWYSERSSQRLVGGFHDVDRISALSAKVDNMASMVQKIAQITLQNQNMSYTSTTPNFSRQIMMCELCGGEHNMGECLNDDMGYQSTLEHVDLVGYGRQQQSFQPQGVYNPNAPRNHLGFSWSNLMGAANPQNFGNRGPPPGFQGQQNFRGGQQQQSMPNQGFQAPTTQPRQSSENSPPPNWEAMMEMMFKSQMKSDERFRQLTEKLDQLGAHNKMLERQIANQASTSSTQVTGKLPAYPENPREHVNAIITRSGKELEEPSFQIEKPMPRGRSNGEIEEEVEKEEATPPTSIPNQRVHNKDDGVKPERKYVPPLPFPQKFQCQAKESRWKKFLNLVENLNVSIPLLDLLTQVPSYGKFLREILSRKRKLGTQEMIAMTQEYRTLIHDEGKFPTKLRDPGSFTIPCVIGGFTINRSLCDLGAGVNVMPLSLCKRLNLGEPKPVQLTLEFADRSTKSPIGILEDVPVRVDKYFVPCDFVVMDIREDPYIPIILGRPFLATTGAIIDARKGSIIFDFGEEKVAFNVFDEPKSPFVEKCYRVDEVGNKRLEKGEEFDALDERTFDEHKKFKKILHEEVGDVALLEKESKVRKIEEYEFLFEDGGQVLQNKGKDWANNSKLKALIEEYPMAFKSFVERFIEARNWKCLENHPG
ncbi:uncharacterized protein LOC116013158 [Ipomoea triloba]|uniref:uncharacterized protein LOC116013158 n=1 Tax=Ipomoea triloba TaxID=35885 RepID=UPI00125CF745|nr:uncharacterized protein LOC116013158 [Ipomoea triloba]